MVPATKDSNLSPDFLESLHDTHGFEYVDAYLDDHAIFQGERCQWLVDNDDGTTTCSVYDIRSSDCRDYPDPTTGSTYCKVGKMYADRNYCK